MDKLRDLLFYAGVKKEQYHQLLPEIHEENRVLLRIFSRIGCIVFFLLFIVSLLSGRFASVNSSTYLTCGIAMVALMLCVWYSVPKYPALVMVLVYLFEVILYVFSIHISMLHEEKPAVSAVVFLLVTPLLFYDRPIKLCALIAVDVVVVCLMVTQAKQPDVAEIDIWNMVTFGGVAVLTTAFIMSIKIRALFQSRQIEYLSQTDVMTGAKNRNYYEKQLLRYPDLCTLNLTCIYGDVNGLHELNYREGHQAGDRMLIEITRTLQSSFGVEHTYRVGGDEFVSFQMDGQADLIASEIERIGEILKKKGYHVSFGTAVQNKADGAIDMEELVKDAESNMFAAKRDYYRQPENNRRNR